MNKKQNAISPTREENFPEWYQQVVKAADLAENSVTRGCMVMKPWGYGIWENVQKNLDELLKETNHVNAYFPLLIPLSFLQKEADHVDGFATETAVVTHHRLEADENGKLIPAGKLEEPYVIRPTSETIIGDSFSRWVQSYRDLPLLINQWANVMRWEMRTRLFLRTSEFLWQEGHTVHATEKEAIDETFTILELYKTFVEEYLALPVISGTKTPDERFPGAVETYSIEAMMQDFKAVQAGTSHFLGQNFSKASNIKFQNEHGNEEFAWTTSWGVSTRLIGCMIMAHSDDDGLVLPPKIATQQVVIQPIYKGMEQRDKVISFCQKLCKEIKATRFNDQKIRCIIDDRDMQGGAKTWDNIKKGYPIRIEVGMRDIDKNHLCIKQRDQSPKEKEFIDSSVFVETLPKRLQSIQDNIYKKALSFQQENTKKIVSLDEFIDYFKNKNGGFAISPWSEAAIDNEVLKELKVTPRNIPFDQDTPNEKCIFTGKDASHYVIFAKAY